MKLSPKFSLPALLTICILILQLILSPDLYAQRIDQERPKIGLVLSGGGAKGLAQIGVLKVLEEAGIRPDIITGTSMGSLVGALYAIGYTPGQMEEIVTHINWGEALGNKTSLDNIAFEEKAYYDRFATSLPMRGSRVSLPQGAIEGQNLWILFSRLTLAAHHIQDFDSLGVPYANIAVDIEKGEVIVQRQGLLPETMRASMAIPSVFTPVMVDGRLLVDGGLIRNLPVQEAIEMGADIIIAVNVGSGFLPAENLNSLMDVLTQASFTYSNLDQKEQKKLAHLLIEPNLKTYSAASFSSSKDIIALGEAAGRLKLSALRQIADSMQEYGGCRKPLPEVEMPENFLLQSVFIEGNHKISGQYIQSRLKIFEGETITLDQLEQRIDYLYGTRYFDHIRYRLIPLKEGYELTIFVKESPSGSLQLAANYDNERGIGLTVNLIQRNLLLPGSRLLLETSVAESPRLDLNYLKYTGKHQNNFLMMGLLYENMDASGFDEEGFIRNTFNTHYFKKYLRLQTTMAKNYSFGMEAGHIYNRTSPRIGNIVQMQDIEFDVSWIRRISDRQYYVKAFLGINTLNRSYFPQKGWTVALSVTQALGASMQFSFRDEFYQNLHEEEERFVDNYFNNISRNSNYLIWSADVQKYLPLNKRLTLMAQTQLIINGTDSPTLTDRIYVGGILPRGQNTVSFWGLHNFENSANAVWKTSLGLQVKMWEKIYVQALTNYLEATDETIPQERKEAGLTFWGYGVGLSYLTPLGPVTVNMSRSDKKDEWLPFVNVGFNL